MKLFVWVNPYRVDYGESMVIAVAETVDDARNLAHAQRVADAIEYKGGALDYDLQPLPLGEPTRVLDAPVAEWHEWSE